MMVPPRTEPANNNGSPNTVIRATEFMLRWKTWAMDRGPSGRAGRADSKFHEQPVRQLRFQKGGGRGDRRHGHAAEGVVQPAGPRPDAEEDAEEAEGGGRRAQQEAERDPPVHE